MSKRIQGVWGTTALLVVLMAAGASTSPVRAAAPPSTLLHFEIPAGDFTEQIELYSMQADMSVLYEFDGVEKLTTQAVYGEFTPTAALEKMLRGTGVIAQYPYRRTITLTRKGSGSADSSIGTGRRAPHMGGSARPPGEGERRVASLREDDITVTGRRASQTPLAEPRIVLDSHDIEISGLATLPGVVRTLPQVFGGGPSEDTKEIGAEANTNTGRGYGVNLRALGAGSSLALMDGHRLASGGTEGSFVDLSSLPLVAVDRLEIVPESSSTRYGADAVGGTVNVVMKDKFAGAQTSAHLGTSTKNDVGENYFSQIFGAETDTGRGLIAVDYYTRGNLEAFRRPQVTSDLSRFGDQNLSPPWANPGTLLIGPFTYAIPAGQDGTHLDPTTLVPGTKNQTDKYAGADVLPYQQRWSAFGKWTNSLADGVSLFTEALVSDRNVRNHGAVPANFFAIPMTNPFRVSPIPGAPVVVSYRFDELGPSISDIKVQTRNIATGLDWDIGRWKAVGTVGYASERLGASLLNTLDRSAVERALADPVRATSLNLFGDGTSNNPATLASLSTTSRFDSNSYLKSVNLTADGPVMSLGGDDLTVLAGVDYRQQAFRALTQTTPNLPLLTQGSQRTVRTVFAEAILPFWGKRNHRQGLESLALSLGARYEDYSDFGQAFTPRVALKWAPTRGLAFRGSWSRSFRAPSLIDLDESQNVATFTPLPDPTAPGGLRGSLVWSGKNADLHEETAHSWTAGIDFTPARVPGLSLAATYFDIDFTDRLDSPLPSADLLTNARFADMVTRNPTAAQIEAVCQRAPNSLNPCSSSLPVSAIVDLRMRNDASLRTRGVDVIGKYVQEVPYGALTLGLNGTYILDFAEAKSAGLPQQDLVSTQNYPIDLRLRGSLGWRLGGFELSSFANFSNHYRDTANARPVGKLLTLDLSLAYEFADDRGPLFSNTSWALTVENLQDRDPPYLQNSFVGIGYDQENADIIGRFISLTIRRNW